MRMTFILGALALLLTSCVNGRITSNKDPFYTDGPRHRFLYVIETGTPPSKKSMEALAVFEFRKKNLTAVPLSTAIPPVREYTDEEKAELLRRVDVQAYVRMRMAGVDRATVHIPSVSYSEATASAYGNTARGQGATVTAGGYSQQVVTGLNFECEVQDAVTLKTIWTGYVEIDVNQQNQYVSFDDYLKKALSLLVERLQQDGIAKKY
ncbi:MAG: hypothetical protein FGM24_09905 [Candidatus Kapabacteria bacterium]|nr:hypothetical protein [Candidatus Kapabacteria bacterium]